MNELYYFLGSYSNNHFFLLFFSENYKWMVSRCRSILARSSFHTEMCDPQKDTNEYSMEENIFSGPVAKSNFFAISLFTRVTDHGIPYCSPVNFRSAMTEVFTKKEDAQNSLVEQVYTGKPAIFSTNPLLATLYEESSVVNKSPEEQRLSEPLFMKSMAKETFKVGKNSTVIKDVVMKMKRIGLFPNQDQWLKVAYILNVKIADALEQEQMPVLLDVKSVIEHLKVLPQTN